MTLAERIMEKAEYDEDIYPIHLVDSTMNALSRGRRVGAQDEYARLMPLIEKLTIALDAADAYLLALIERGAKEYTEPARGNYFNSLAAIRAELEGK